VWSNSKLRRIIDLKAMVISALERVNLANAPRNQVHPFSNGAINNRRRLALAP